MLAVAAGHPIAKEAAKNSDSVALFVEECKNNKVSEADMATMEKKGIATGFFATHPLLVSKYQFGSLTLY